MTGAGGGPWAQWCATANPLRTSLSVLVRIQQLVHGVHTANHAPLCDLYPAASATQSHRRRRCQPPARLSLAIAGRNTVARLQHRCAPATAQANARNRISLQPSPAATGRRCESAFVCHPPTRRDLGTTNKPTHRSPGASHASAAHMQARVLVGSAAALTRSQVQHGRPRTRRDDIVEHHVGCLLVEFPCGAVAHGLRGSVRLVSAQLPAQDTARGGVSSGGADTEASGCQGNARPMALFSNSGNPATVMTVALRAACQSTISLFHCSSCFNRVASTICSLHGHGQLISNAWA